MLILPLYHQMMESGNVINENGLCYVINWRLAPNKYDEWDALLRLFTPNEQEKNQLETEGLSRTFWAEGQKKSFLLTGYEFTPLRQTIVLFMAAINGEL